jgi:flagellar hook-associated protein 1 FlgK
VQATNYKVEYNGTELDGNPSADKTSFTATADASGNLSFDGLNVNISGSANTKDSFVVKPVNDVIINMDLAISDESKLAMASASGSAIAITPTVKNCWICKAPKWQ